MNCQQALRRSCVNAGNCLGDRAHCRRNSMISKANGKKYYESDGSRFEYQSVWLRLILLSLRNSTSIMHDKWKTV